MSQFFGLVATYFDVEAITFQGYWEWRKKYFGTTNDQTH
jgi:hypothetical protein